MLRLLQDNPDLTQREIAQQLGVSGRLRRDEVNRARSRDVYAQAVPTAVSPCPCVE